MLQTARGGAPSEWIATVRGDHRYNELLELRHALNIECARAAIRSMSPMPLLSRTLPRSVHRQPRAFEHTPRRMQTLRRMQRRGRPPPAIRTARASRSGVESSQFRRFSVWRGMSQRNTSRPSSLSSGSESVAVAIASVG